MQGLAKENQTTSISLSTRQRDENEVNTTPAEMPTQELGPVDGGRAAWTVLIAAFVFEAIFWGQ
jgi:hypothetical protein